MVTNLAGCLLQLQGYRGSLESAQTCFRLIICSERFPLLSRDSLAFLIYYACMLYLE